MILSIRKNYPVSAKSPAFNAKTSNKETNNARYEALKQSYKEQGKLNLAAGAVGLATWAGSSLANANKPLRNGIIGYFVALGILFAGLGIKELKEKNNNKLSTNA